MRLRFWVMWPVIIGLGHWGGRSGGQRHREGQESRRRTDRLRRT